MATTIIYPADLIGGHPALDLLNTIHDWTVTERHDRLEDFAVAVRFAELAGVVSPAEGRRLMRERQQSPRAAVIELGRLRRLRALLERLFRASVRSASPDRADLSALDAIGVEVARASEWATAGGRTSALHRRVTLAGAGLATPRLRIADSAATLLDSASFDRIKDCPGCGWFFLDASKNHSRRWCSMDTCGSSAKSKAYYRRVTSRIARDNR